MDHISGKIYANFNSALTLTGEEKHSEYYREGKTRSPGPQGQHPLPVRFRFRLTHQSCPISILIYNQKSLISQTTPDSNPHFAKSKKCRILSFIIFLITQETVKGKNR